VIIPKAQASTAITLEATVQGTKYVGKTTVSSASAVGDAVVMEKQA
jgi:hypothetical protein